MTPSVSLNGLRRGKASNRSKRGSGPAIPIGAKTMAKKVKFRVNYGGHSGGPTFTSITEALAFVRHILKSESAIAYPVIIVPVE